MKSITSGRNWKIVEGIFKQHTHIFGKKRFSSKGSESPKDKEAAGFHREFGPGYNKEAPGNEQKRKSKEEELEKIIAQITEIER